MVKIILIRPGTTQFDLQGRILGTLDVPLSEEGASEVVTAAGALRGEDIDTIYCSPSQSAVETAEGIARSLGTKPKHVKALENVNYGLWQGLLVDEVRRKQPRVFKQWQEHPETICPPEGEMISAARKRFETAIAKLLKKHKQGTIAMVVPEPAFRIVRSLLTHTEPVELGKFGGDCGAWEAIDLNNGHVIPDGHALGSAAPRG